MKLVSLLKKIEYSVLKGNEEIEIKTLVYDSRKVCDTSVFVCITGAIADGHSFIQQVIDSDAKAIIVEDIDLSKYDFGGRDITIIKVDDTRLALAYMSAEFFGNPAKKLKTIGITGTKGKTTTSYIVKSMLDKAGHKTGLIGTIEVIIGDVVIKSLNTTPESYIVQKYFAKMVEEGCDCVVMEVSSQGLMLNRVAGFEFDYGIFNNLSPDHIGPHEHKDFDDYLRCKAMLFKQCKTGIINIDDKYANDIIKGHTCSIETFGFSKEADLNASDVKLLNENGKLGVAYHLSGKRELDVKVNVPGKFSVYNSLTAIAICRHFDVPEDVIKAALMEVSVKGRVEIVDIGDKDYTVMIDYAHNAMSMESLLTTIKEYNPKRLVTVFGAGGNRDKQRRYEMGEISAKYADLSIVTSDNPRYEEPEAIIKDILVGVEKGKGKYITIVNRREAIKYSMENAQDGDVIILIGKGHESYQDIKGVKYDFDERKVVKQILQELD